MWKQQLDRGHAAKRKIILLAQLFTSILHYEEELKNAQQTGIRA